jgi:exopolysaccharide biosynthesis polyprenyl glycosylphosphotransferase
MTAHHPPDHSMITNPATEAFRADPRPTPNNSPVAIPPPDGFPRRSQRRRVTPEVRLRLRLVRISDTVVVISTLLAAFLATNIGRMPEGLAGFLALRITVKNLGMLLLFAVAWRVLCRSTGLYDWESIRRRREESVRVVVTCGLVSAVALVFPTVSATGAFSYKAVLFFWVGSSVAILAFRNLMRTLVPGLVTGRPRDALIVGTGPRGQRLERELRSWGAEEYNVVGFIDAADHRSGTAGSESLLGTLTDLETILMRRAIDEVLITLPIKSRYTEIQSVLESCERVGVPARYLADLFDPIRGRSGHDGSRPSLVTIPSAPEGWRLVAKRAMDLTVALALLAVLSPALLLAAVGIKLTSRGPVLFTQERYGLNRRRFRMYKLRTMVADAEELQVSLESLNEASGPVFKIREDPRITPVGRLLRRTSLDELPQLLNVLLGDMSLVGPRPLPVRDVDRFAEAALMRRFSIRPGITCLWQIGGRSTLGFDDWIRLDLKYIDEWSLTLDMLILVRTIPAVIRGTGAS